MGNAIKRRKVFNYLHSKNFEIVLLQESHSTKAVEKVWRNEWGSQIHFSRGSTNSCGVAILISRSLDFKLITLKRDSEGRFLQIVAKIEGMRITILNCYAPNSDSPNYFAQNFAQSGILENDSCIIGGDFNTILTSQDMRGAVINQHPKTTDPLLELMQHYELVDIWRIQNDNKFMYTWMRNNPPIYKQLNYILVSSHLQQDVVRTGIGPAFSSNHSIPWIQIDQSHVA